MKVMRCKKLNGKKVPRSCHFLNGRKEHCDDFFETDEQEEIKMFELKATAPDKLYVDIDDYLTDSVLYGFTEKRKEDDIEYTRTDAFIEKAEEYLEEHFSCKCNWGYVTSDDYCSMKDFIEDFKKYMKG